LSELPLLGVVAQRVCEPIYLIKIENNEIGYNLALDFDGLKAVNRIMIWTRRQGVYIPWIEMIC
jgi:hypothetical protein